MDATHPLVLIVDDDERNARLMSDVLSNEGYRTERAFNGLDGLCAAGALRPDLVLLDIKMPDMDGFQVCAALRERPDTRAIPIVMMTAHGESEARDRGLDAGADDFVLKPIEQRMLLARVRSLLRMKSLYDEVSHQREELTRWSSMLERRVQDKVSQIERLARLKRFFSPRLAEKLVDAARDDPLQSHRGEVSVLFADLRGFTAFAEAHDAEKVMAVLREFHAAMGALIFRFEGTLERFTGDGMMVFFNDPDPVADHCMRALSLGLAMCEATDRLQAAWRRDGGPQGIAIGVSTGEVTLGAIGFEGRVDYAAIGTATNLAARLCSEARPGEVLVSDAAWAQVDTRGLAGTHDALTLKGFSQPVGCVRLQAGSGLRR